MRIDIIGFEIANVVRLRDRLIKRGHAVRLIPAEELYVDLSSAGPVVVPYDTLARPDVVVSHTTTDTLTAFEALQELAASGVPVVNQAPALIKSANKFLTALAITAAGVRHPRVIQVCTERAVLAAAQRLGYPLVLKATDGAEGDTVYMIKQASDVSAAIASIRRYIGRDPAARTPLLVQELMAESLGHDRRVFVAGGAAIAGMERVAQPGEWRSNLSQGAHPRPATLRPAEARAAVQSVAALGLDFAVVDIMPLQDGPVVIEVNSGGDVVDIIAMSGVDIIGVLCRFIESKGGGSWDPSEAVPMLEQQEWQNEVKFAWDRIDRKAEELARRAATRPQ